MGLSFSKDKLSLLDGRLFDSHKKKVEEMKSDWEAYPFAYHELKPKSSESFAFRKFYAECPCGRKGNLSCLFEKFSKCSRKQSSECKAHKVKKSGVWQE